MPRVFSYVFSYWIFIITQWDDQKSFYLSTLSAKNSKIRDVKKLFETNCVDGNIDRFLKYGVKKKNRMKAVRTTLMCLDNMSKMTSCFRGDASIDVCK